jgi:hypothetical protein
MENYQRYRISGPRLDFNTRDGLLYYSNRVNYIQLIRLEPNYHKDYKGHNTNGVI